MAETGQSIIRAAQAAAQGYRALQDASKDAVKDAGATPATDAQGRALPSSDGGSRGRA